MTHYLCAICEEPLESLCGHVMADLQQHSIIKNKEIVEIVETIGNQIIRQFRACSNSPQYLLINEHNLNLLENEHSPLVHIMRMDMFGYITIDNAPLGFESLHNHPRRLELIITESKALKVL